LKKSPFFGKTSSVVGTAPSFLLFLLKSESRRGWKVYLRHLSKKRLLSYPVFIYFSLPGNEIMPIISMVYIASSERLHGVMMNGVHRMVTPKKRTRSNLKTNCPSEGQ
jgi:hypothetical protein